MWLKVLLDLIKDLLDVLEQRQKEKDAEIKVKEDGVICIKSMMRC